MARIDLPVSKLRARRRRRRALLAGALVFVVLVLAAGAVWLAHAPFVRVVSVEVSGAQSVASSTIEEYVRSQMAGDYLWLFPRDNIFLYPRRAIEAGLLARYPALRSVDVHAADFRTVAVAAVERQPAALWCPTGATQEGCFYMDEDGVVYSPAPDFSSPVYVSYEGALAPSAQAGARQYLAPADFQSLSALAGALGQKEPDDPVRTVVVDDSRDVRVYFQNDFVLIFNLKDDGGDIFERFTLALASDPFKGKSLGDFEYLDLRFGDKLYYKLKGQ